MIAANAWATHGPTSPLAPFSFSRRDPGPRDIVIDIEFCGICHSDVHQARNEWSSSSYPMVPGHEIVGRVSRVGAEVSRFAVGQRAGVGCFVDSCRGCASCRMGQEQFCEVHCAFTYNGTEMDLTTPTQGGYSTCIVVDESYALRVAEGLPAEQVAPLLCAGITTWSPLRRFGVGAGKRVGIVGLGGLGHMGVKLAASLGAEVTLFSTSPRKKADALRLGAHDFILSSDESALASAAGRFDFILDTVSAGHEIGPLLNALRTHGTLCLVGAPEHPLSLPAMPLLGRSRTVAGSMIGGIAETQEMLDYCASHSIGADVEVIPISSVNEAYDRVVRNDVKYRFVIDIASLR